MMKMDGMNRSTGYHLIRARSNAERQSKARPCSFIAIHLIQLTMSSSADLYVIPPPYPQTLTFPRDDAFLTAANAVDESGPLSPSKQRLDTRLRLTLWGLYQQATQGDAPEDGEDALGGLGFGKKVLWREWRGRKGMNERDAKVSFGFFG